MFNSPFTVVFLLVLVEYLLVLLVFKIVEEERPDVIILMRKQAKEIWALIKRSLVE